MTKIVRNVDDIEGLEFGDAYVVFVEGMDAFDDDPDGPIALLDSPAYLAGQELEAAIAEKFAPPAKVFVSFTDTHLVVSADRDHVASIGGDVRDNENVNLVDGKPRRYVLTDEGFGYVTVDGIRYSIPDRDGE